VNLGLNREFLLRTDLETLGFARLGDDVLIHKSVVIVDCSKIALGSHIRIDPFVVISTRGGAEFGDYVHIGSHTVVAGHASVHFSDFVNISHHVGIYTSNEDVSGHTLSHPMVPVAEPGRRTASIVFAKHSGVGAGSIVLSGARFGEGTILGAMSRTSRPLKPWTTYEGIPARRMRERHRETLAKEEAFRASLQKGT
jgi:dTDP-4-amino-4,6-dideoxy-D-glucose acyltransferase